MPPTKKTKTVEATDEEVDDGERWNVKQLFQELLLNRFPALSKRKQEFIDSKYWKDIYTKIMDYTINRSDYKGFPTKTSYKNTNTKSFPNTSTADRNDIRFNKILDNFITEFDDDFKDSIDVFVSTGTCDISNYMWGKITIPEVESSVKETTIIEKVAEEQLSILKNMNTIPIRKQVSNKRKYEEISDSTVYNYMEKVASCLQLEKENKDYEMKASLNLLNELDELLSNNQIEKLQHEVEEENQCFNYFMEFFRKRIERKTNECSSLTKNFKDLQQLQTKLSSYISKRREKMTSEREKKKTELDDLIQKLITDDE